MNPDKTPLMEVWANYIANRIDRDAVREFLEEQSLCCRDVRTWPEEVFPVSLALGHDIGKCKHSGNWVFLHARQIPRVLRNRMVELFNNEDLSGGKITYCHNCCRLRPSYEAEDVDEDNYMVCRSCLENNYTWSEQEDRWVHNDDTCSVYTNRRNCFMVSQNYADNNYRYYEDEGIWCTDDYFDELTDGDDGDDSEYNEPEEYSRRTNPFDPANVCVIASYHSSKRYIHLLKQPEGGTPERPLYVGMELEIEVEDEKHGAARAMKALLNGAPGLSPAYEEYCLIEDDGSLDDGFEIVTGWGTVADHERRLVRLSSPEFGKVRKAHGMKSHDTSTCGLHISIDRAGMSTLHASKFVVFLNAEANKPLIEAVCRRYNEGYCKAKPKQYSSLVKVEESLGTDKYEIANFREDGRTIEFRGPKGTLKYQSILAAMEFIRMVWLFTENTSIGKLTTRDFLAFIHQKEWTSDTKYLRPYLVEKGVYSSEVRGTSKVLTGAPRRLRLNEAVAEAEAMGFIAKSMDV